MKTGQDSRETAPFLILCTCICLVKGLDFGLNGLFLLEYDSPCGVDYPVEFS